MMQSVFILNQILIDLDMSISLSSLICRTNNSTRKT